MLLKIGLIILSLFIAAWLVPGIVITGLYPALIIVVMLGLANITIKPVLTLLTLPIHFITFGLSSLLINAFVFWFLATFIAGFTVSGFVSAFLGSIIVTIVASVGSLLK